MHQNSTRIEERIVGDFITFSFADADQEDKDGESCEANADEQESVTMTEDFDEGNIRLRGRTGSRRWDYFPAQNSSPEDDDSDKNCLSERINEKIGSAQRVFSSNNSIMPYRRFTSPQSLMVQKQAEYNKQEQKAIMVKKSITTKFTNHLRTATTLKSPGRQQQRFGMTTNIDTRRGFEQSTNNQNSRQTFHSPGAQLRAANFFNENDTKREQRKTLDLSPNYNGSFLIQSARAFPEHKIKSGHTAKQISIEEQSWKSPLRNNYEGRNSVQRLPQSHLSRHSLFGGRKYSHLVYSPDQK